MTRLLSFVAAVVLLVSTATLVTAQESAQETLRAAREAQAAARLEAADLAKDLDVLEATDDELIAALQALSEQIHAQEALVESARNDVAQARATEERLRAEIVVVTARSAELRELTVERAVAAYVAPRDNAVASGDPTQDARRDALFRQVDLNSKELIDELRAVNDDLAALETEADEAAIAAAEREAELNAALTRLEGDRAAQENIRAQLSEEIQALEAELDEMAAVEAELSGIIRDKQREIAREEALRRAALTTTTTSTTSTTAPASTDPDSPGTTTETLVPASTDQVDSGSSTTTSAPVVVPASNPDLIWPTTGSVTSSFGNRIHPISGSSRFHAGIDISSRTGNPIWAAQSGTVIYSGWMRGYGETVMIDHGGFVTLYAHQSERQVSEGTRVSQGQQIGLIGSTGDSTGPHLHFEVRINGSATNPAAYLP